ncbi:MAG: ferredoxin [Rhodospirillales bacterium]|nr:ferredoxin [Rhodospirillales bacterium]MDH3911720.1 ferredoxin [Rhodospirillales bacterium]MDH3919017.1 ferredoxin [Rhodospirillales bacterium]MDH3967713.1 ferredoxin [Rhodospirillales bacterium]
MDIATIERAAAAEGLTLRGAFHPTAADEVPGLPDGRAAGTLVLLGNVGPTLWSAFVVAPEYGDGAPDPLNRWSERVIGALADALDARPLFPFGRPPYRPFVAWAKRAEPVAESPLGMLIHPDHGLWHAYRGALAFAGEIALPAPGRRPRPCDTCATTPCLTGCPVGAFTTEGYDVVACARHVAAPAGADCLELGCRARRACPVGPERHYHPAQARFHMAAFLAARRAEAPA